MALKSAQEADLVEKIREIHQNIIREMPDKRVLEVLEEKEAEADPDDIVDQVVAAEYRIAAARRGLLKNPKKRRRKNPSAHGEAFAKSREEIMKMSDDNFELVFPSFRKQMQAAEADFNAGKISAQDYLLALGIWTAAQDDLVRRMGESKENSERFLDLMTNNEWVELRESYEAVDAQFAPGAVKNPRGRRRRHASGFSLDRTKLKGLYEDGVRDFSKSNLSGQDLSYLNLDGADFSGADLSEVDFEGANLRGVDLTDANIRDADFFKAAVDETTSYRTFAPAARRPDVYEGSKLVSYAEANPKENPKGLAKDVKRLLKIAEKQDCVIIKGRKHFKVRCPQGRQFTVAASPSDSRAIHRIKRDLTNIGGVQFNPSKGGKRIVAGGKVPKSLSKTMAKRREKARKNPIRHSPSKRPRTLMRGRKPSWEDVFGDESQFTKMMYGQLWRVTIVDDPKGYEVMFGPDGSDEEMEWLYYTGKPETYEILADVEVRIRDLSKNPTSKSQRKWGGHQDKMRAKKQKARGYDARRRKVEAKKQSRRANPCIGLHFHAKDADDLMKAAAKAEKKMKKNPGVKKIIAGWEDVSGGDETEFTKEIDGKLWWASIEEDADGHEVEFGRDDSLDHNDWINFTGTTDDDAEGMLKGVEAAIRKKKGAKRKSNPTKKKNKNLMAVKISADARKVLNDLNWRHRGVKSLTSQKDIYVDAVARSSKARSPQKAMDELVAKRLAKYEQRGGAIRLTPKGRKEAGGMIKVSAKEAKKSRDWVSKQLMAPLRNPDLTGKEKGILVAAAKKMEFGPTTTTRWYERRFGKKVLDNMIDQGLMDDEFGGYPMITLEGLDVVETFHSPTLEEREWMDIVDASARAQNPKKKPAPRKKKVTKKQKEIFARLKKSKVPWKFDVNDLSVGGQFYAKKGPLSVSLRQWDDSNWEKGWTVHATSGDVTLQDREEQLSIKKAIKQAESHFLQPNPKKKPASRKKTLKGRAERTGRKIEKGAKKAGRKAKKFAKTKEGYAAGGAGVGALLLGPIGAVAGAIGGAELHKNPERGLSPLLEKLSHDTGETIAKGFIENTGGYAESDDTIFDALNQYAAYSAGVNEGPFGKWHDPPEAPRIMYHARFYVREAGIDLNDKVGDVWKKRKKMRKRNPRKIRKTSQMSDDELLRRYWEIATAARSEKDPERRRFLKEYADEWKSELKARGVKIANPRRKNPSKGKHLAIADRKWNMFESAYDSFSVSDSAEDLLAAYTAALEAELHYKYAGVSNEDGRGSGPAGAEASGIEMQLYERLGR